MTRKSVRRRLEFESLETMTLLSGISPLAHPAAELIIGRGDPLTAVTLSGIVKGTYKSHGVDVPDSFTTKGTLRPLGKVTLTGSAEFSANSTGSMTIAHNKHDKIFATLVTHGLEGAVSYTITGGTGTFAGATGGADADFIFTIAPHKGNAAVHGKLTIAFIDVPL